MSAVKKSQKKSGSMLGHSIDNGSLQFTKLIGVGTYGEVYKTLHRSQNKEYAVKVLERKKNKNVDQMLEEPFVDARILSLEIRLYAKIPPHPNIIRLERILHTRDQLFIVMENCSGGDLYENISGNPHFHLPGNDALIKRLFTQLLNAVSHCHRYGVYHRDLKPENILVTQDGLNVKLIDFGLSTDKQWSNEIGCGSAYYMSPESQGGLDGKTTHYATAPNDVWALGIILINLATGRNPWNRAHLSDPLFCRYLKDKSFLCQAINATPSFSHIIQRAIEVDPSKRCTIYELKDLVENCKQFICSRSLFLSNTARDKNEKISSNAKIYKENITKVTNDLSDQTINSDEGYNIAKKSSSPNKNNFFRNSFIAQKNLNANNNINVTEDFNSGVFIDSPNYLNSYNIFHHKQMMS
ncbi:Negative regulator of sexual conjugation and meiosis [Smittium culicis]|uniref:Negative regulator of sexual conjugation and meiosis n=1 Tax=Smittium culicis TaxID=133412 RepID=A0A1R1XGI1_9FUNG|nr:Negative regulator of sexual conjugation and meiosis [Smittium culicis]OMJ13745.1 Negative regulator of sexual conjugation and meiosis [Smittium culicis]